MRRTPEATALSPVTDWGAASIRIAGPKPQGGPNDLFALAEKIDRRLLPALRIDCGTDDFLIEDNRWSISTPSIASRCG